MPKDSLRDKIDGNQLDLSLSNLTVVPVKEMAGFPKVTHVDLSCNLLSSLPSEFCSLTHIMKLDISKNQLQSLPEDFGNLQKLVHLDLFGNRLTTLPLSFFRLKNLKWLDLRDNPLIAELKDVTGECLTEAECKQCAKNVVSYMKHVQADIERNRQKKLQEQRELEAARKAEEESARQRKKAEKRAEKERRRREYQARLAAEGNHTTEGVAKQQETKPDEKISNGLRVHLEKREKGGLPCSTVCLTSLFTLLVIFAITYYFCYMHQGEPFCRDVKQIVMPYWMSAQEVIRHCMGKR